MRVAFHAFQRHGLRKVTVPIRVIGVLPINSFSSQSSSTSNSLVNATYFKHKNSNKQQRFQFIDLKFKSTGAIPYSSLDKEKEDKETLTPEIVKEDFEVKKNKPMLLDLGIPSMVPEWKKMFDPSTLFTDVAAGITVGCIAVPLSLAIAVASGVPPEVGLVTAAVSGVAGGLLGGTTLAITGPAAAISLLVVGAVTEHGLEALPFITLTCGGLQVLSGVTRIGTVAKLVPVSVIAGFTTGVGMMILSGQVPKALGMTAPAGMNPIETMAFIGENAASINPSAAALALGVSGAMYALPKVHPKMPSALLAIGGATLATSTMGLDVAAVGQIPSGLEAFQFAIPSLPPVDSIPSLAATTFLIFAMTSAESLLSCAALEKMKKTSYQHNPDQELVGQGLANMGAGMFMGMPVTSVIARSSLNVKLNAESRLPALVQAGFVFGSVVFFSDSISTIPMPALSGMLISTGLGMLSPAEFKHCFAVQKADAIPFITTIGGMVAFGLAEGIGIGCLSAWALNYDSFKTNVKEMSLPNKMEFTQTTLGWQVRGPINFESMFKIDDLIHRIEETTTDDSDKIVLDMQETRMVEFTGVEELVNRLLEIKDKHSELDIELWNCHPNLKSALKQCDPSERIKSFGIGESDEAPFYFPTSEDRDAPKSITYMLERPTFDKVDAK